MSRINPNSTISDIIQTMSGAAIGTMTVVRNVLICADGLEIIKTLDRNRIYGSDIWILYKYICNCSIPNMFAVVRALHLNSGAIDLIAQFNAGKPVNNINLAALMAIPGSVNIVAAV